MPGASPGCRYPFAKVYAWGNTSSVSAVWPEYSWIPKLCTARSRWTAAAMPTGEMSSGPWIALLIWYWAAKSKSLRSGVTPPKCVTAERT